MSWFWGKSKPAEPVASAAAAAPAPAPVQQKPVVVPQSKSTSSWWWPFGKKSEESPKLTAVAADATESMTSLIDPYFAKFAPAGVSPVKLSGSAAMGIFTVVSITDTIMSVGSWTRFLLTTAYTIATLFAVSWFIRYKKDMYAWLVIVGAIVVLMFNGNAFINHYFKK